MSTKKDFPTGYEKEPNEHQDEHRDERTQDLPLEKTGEFRELSGKLIFQDRTQGEYNPQGQDEATGFAKTAMYRRLEPQEIAGFLATQESQKGLTGLQSLSAQGQLNHGEAARMIDGLQDQVQEFSQHLEHSGMDQAIRERAQEQVRQACFEQIASIIPQEDNQHRLTDALLREREMPQEGTSYGQRVVDAMREQADHGWKHLSGQECLENLEQVQQENLEHRLHMEQNRQENFTPEHQDPVDHEARAPDRESAATLDHSRATATIPVPDTQESVATAERLNHQPTAATSTETEQERPQAGFGKTIWRALWGKPEGWMSEYPQEDRDQEADKQIEKMAKWAKANSRERTLREVAMGSPVPMYTASHTLEERDIPPMKEFMKVIMDHAGTGRIPEELREQLAEENSHKKLHHGEGEPLLKHAYESIKAMQPELERLELPDETWKQIEEMTARVLALECRRNRYSVYFNSREGSGNFNHTFNMAYRKYDNRIAG